MFSRNIFEAVSNLKALAAEAGTAQASRGWADTVPATDLLRDHQLREARQYQAYLPTLPAPLSSR